VLIYRIMPASRANGPGLRAVVWFQGCSLGCHGCWNQQTHDRTPRPELDLSINEVTNRLLADFPQGITFTGGEPIQQLPALAALCISLLRAAPGISLGMFSGYSPAELDRAHFQAWDWHGREIAEGERMGLWGCVRNMLDWAALGRYDRTQAAGGPLCSSSNQELRLYTTRYTLADFETSYEATIDPAGLTQITGFPT